MTTYDLAIPLGATVTATGMNTSAAHDAVDLLNEAIQDAGGSAKAIPGDPSLWKVTIPDSGAVVFKLKAGDVLRAFGI